jgi:hypothetical protein
MCENVAGVSWGVSRLRGAIPGGTRIPPRPGGPGMLQDLT